MARAAAGAGYEGLNRYYTLERRANLAAPDWSPAPGFDAILGQGQPVLLAESVAGIPARYYRLKAWLAR